ncbi:hypothetical protein CLG96_04750 [Sphingomonas oleivorans]|uniref:DUF2141 domain-containing protein n=1 Tax=Sphingomonas oleivorans TaxID=1735121 RepID=A0A2T5G2N7_9SPHN|nr:DUF2141 domain-containing protein [Sphingomonas oleivorans]PTQ13409.1 hypothetical protein CLG96_04750 [Sphingomonas oleivorans]
MSLALLALMLLPGASPGTQLDVGIAALRSQKGALLVCLTRDPAHFPDCKNDPAARHLTVAAASPVIRFSDLPSGDYALSLIHDENGNGRLDMFAGIPREGIGFSRNPRLLFGPPRFSAVRFHVEGGLITQDIRIRYFL